MQYRIRIPLFLLTVLCLCATATLAQQGDRVAKSYDWSYTLSSGDQVEFFDRYGTIDIETTTGNKLEVEVEVEAWGNNEEVAQRVLDAVTVRHSTTTGSYSFVTDIDERRLRDSNRKGFHVRYTVKLPRNARLRLQEFYGKVALGDFEGDTDIRVKYGSLRAGKLNGRYNEIEVQYSSGRIEAINSGSLVLAYGNGYFEVGEVGELRFNPRYSKVRMESVKRLDLDAAYSELNIGSVGTLTGSASYSELEIESVATSVTLTARYLGDFRLRRLATGFEGLDLDVAYSDIYLGLPQNLNAAFDLTVNYGDLDGFSYFSQVNYQRRENKDGRYLHYRGTMGRGGSRIYVQARYSDIRMDAY